MSLILDSYYFFLITDIEFPLLEILFETLNIFDVAFGRFGIQF